MIKHTSFLHLSLIIKTYHLTSGSGFPTALHFRTASENSVTVMLDNNSLKHGGVSLVSLAVSGKK